MSALADLFRLGGPLMWPLALCSALLMAFLIERAITVSSAQWKTDERQRALHRRHLLFFVEVAPALGLLGTMHGIIECFKIFGGSGPSMSALEGLGIACITTVYGLVIALVAQVATYILDSLARPQADEAGSSPMPVAVPIEAAAQAPLSCDLPVAQPARRAAQAEAQDMAAPKTEPAKAQDGAMP